MQPPRHSGWPSDSHKSSGYIQNRGAPLNLPGLSKMHDLRPRSVCGKEGHEHMPDTHAQHRGALSGARLQSPKAGRTLVKVCRSHLLSQTHDETAPELARRGKDAFLFLSLPPSSCVVTSPAPRLLFPASASPSLLRGSSRCAWERGGAQEVFKEIELCCCPCCVHCL